MHPHDLPPQLSPANTNALATPGSIGKRPGTSSAATGLPGSSKIVGMVAVEEAGWQELDTGRLWVMTDSGTFVPEAGTGVNPDFTGSTNYAWFGPAQRASMASDQRKLWMIPILDGKRAAENGFYGAPSPFPTALPVALSFDTMFRTPMPAITTLSAIAGGANTTPGTHYLILCPVFADGSIGPPSPPASVTTIAGQRIQVGGPLWVGGPALSTQRLWIGMNVYMTTAGGGVYYFAQFFSGATGTNVDVSDTYLGAQARFDFPDNIGLRYTPLMPSAAFALSGQRLALVNARNNYGFPAGGLLNGYLQWLASPDPYGWNLGTGATTVQTGPGGSYAIRMTGNGATAERGITSNNGDLLIHVGGVSGPGGNGSADAINCGTAKILFRARKSAGITSGQSVQFKITATGGTYGTRTFTLPCSQIGTAWTTNEIALTPVGNTPNPTGYALAISLIGTAPNNEYVEWTVCDIIPGGAVFDAGTVHYSQANLQMVFNDGESQCVVGSSVADEVRNVFELFGRHFVAKMHSLWEILETQDAPSTWTPRLISDRIGTLSYAGVGHGPNFKIIVGKEGCWFFQGSPLALESNLAWEILPDWNAINWAYGHLIWCHVVPEDKLVLIGVPTNGATEVSEVWALSYLEGWERPDQNPGKGRKWFTWTLAAASFYAHTRGDGTLARFLGNNDASGKIRKLDSSLVDDEGSAMAWSYETGRFLVSPALNTLERVTIDAHGTGEMAIAVRDNQENLTAIGSKTLYDPSRGQSRYHTRKVSEKFGFQLSMGAVGDDPTLDRVEPVVYPYRHMAARLLNP